MSFWCFVSVFLDVFPWFFLMFLPLLKSLRFSLAKTLVVSATVIIVYQIGYAFLCAVTSYNLNIMLIHRLFQFVLTIILTTLLVKDHIGKIAFVFSLLYPCIICVISLASFFMGYMEFEKYPVYMLPSIIRIVLSIVIFPIAYLFFKKDLVPIMDVQQKDIWNFAWLFPATITMICLLLTGNDFEIHPVKFNIAITMLLAFCCTMCSVVFLFKTLEKEKNRLLLQARSEHGNQLLSLQYKQYEELKESIDYAKKTRHDVKNHMSVIREMAEKQQYDNLCEYVDKFVQTIPKKSTLVYCQNYALNAIVEYYSSIAISKDIEVETKIDIGNNENISDIDYCIMIGNLFENAITACDKLKEKKKIIKIKCKKFENKLAIIVSNTFDGDVKIENNRFLSRKRNYESYGVGLDSVRSAVNKYNGYMKVESENNLFTVSLLLQIS